MAVYFVDGQILFDSGSVAFSEDCCCGGGEVDVDCCEVNLPETLTATGIFSCQSGTPCGASVEIELNWNSGDMEWQGSGTFCGITVDLAFGCDGSTSTDWYLEEQWSGGCYGPTTDEMPDSGSCDPFEVVFLVHSLGVTCAEEILCIGIAGGDEARIQWTITE